VDMDEAPISYCRAGCIKRGPQVKERFDAILPQLRFAPQGIEAR
jgi:hypothetical protein